jgi:hypothetical protein
MTWSPAGRWGRARPAVKWKKEGDEAEELNSLASDFFFKFWHTLYLKCE